MKKKIIKKIILYTFITIVFFLLATTIIYYAKGYRYNFNTGKIEKTGMILLEFYPSRAKVYFEDKELKREKTPIKIRNLKAGNYKLRIEKEDYYTWGKTLNVKPEKVNWIYYAILLPKNPDVQQLTTEATSTFSLAHDDRKIAYINTNPENMGIWTIDPLTKKQSKIFPIKNQHIKDQNTEYILENLKWSPDSNKLLFIQKKKNLSYSPSIFIVNINKPSEVILLKEFYPYNFSEINWIPENNNELIGLYDQNLYKINITSPGDPKILADHIKEFTLSKNKIYYIKQTDKISLWETDYEGNNQNKILDLENSDYELYSSISHNNLALYKKTDQNLQVIIKKNNQFEINSINNTEIDYVSWCNDEKKLFYKNNHEIWMCLLEKEGKETFEKNLVTRLEKNINQVTWYPDYNHLIFNTEGQIKICELDGENTVNFINTSLTTSELITTSNKIYRKPTLFILNQQENQSSVNLYSIKLFKD